MNWGIILLFYFFVPMLVSLVVMLKYRIIWRNSLGQKGITFIESLLLNALIFCVMSIPLLFSKMGQALLYFGMFCYPVSFIFNTLVSGLCRIKRKRITEDQWRIYSERNQKSIFNKKRIILSLLSLIFMLGFGNYFYENNWGKASEWNINWDFKVPQPANLKVVYESGGFQDYTGYHIAEFSDGKFDKAKQFPLWHKINDSDYEMISNRVSSFRGQIIGMGLPEEEPNRAKLFSDNPIEFDKDSLWYFKEKSNGDYFIAILNTKTKRLYVMEFA